MSHKVTAFVIFWTVAVVAGIAAEVATEFQVPIRQLVLFAGLVTATYIGVDEITSVLESAKLPRGVGVESERTPLWLVVTWSLLMLGSLTVQAIFADAALPIAEIVSFAGVLTAEYVGGESANRTASLSGKEEA